MFDYLLFKIFKSNEITKSESVMIIKNNDQLIFNRVQY